MLDRAGGRGVTSLTFDSAEAMDRTRAHVDDIRSEVTRAAGARVLDTGEFELVIAHLDVPEMV